MECDGQILMPFIVDKDPIHLVEEAEILTCRSCSSQSPKLGRAKKKIEVSKVRHCLSFMPKSWKNCH